MLRRNIRNDQVLPYCQADFTAAIRFCDICDRAHFSCRKVADWNNNADVMHVRLRLWMNPDMSRAIDWFPGLALAGGNADERKRKTFLRLLKESFNSPAVY